MAFMEEVVEAIASKAIMINAMNYAEEYVQTLVGNSGQEVILDQGLPAFRRWCAEVFSGYANDISAHMMEALGEDKWRATDQIWRAGADSFTESINFGF